MPRTKSRTRRSPSTKSPQPVELQLVKAASDFLLAEAVANAYRDVVARYSAEIVELNDQSDVPDSDVRQELEAAKRVAEVVVSAAEMQSSLASVRRDLLTGVLLLG